MAGLIEARADLNLIGPWPKQEARIPGPAPHPFANGAGGRGAPPRNGPGSPHLEVVVPAFNEAARVGGTLRELRSELDALPGVRSTIRVIDNGSTDGTAEIVDEVNRSGPGAPITVEGCARQGKGSAVTRGMVTSTADWVGFCDADLSTPASVIGPTVSYLQQGWPIVVGSRRVKGSQVAGAQPALRRLGGGGFRLLARTMISGVQDTQCGFKFFQGEIARQLFRGVELQGFAFDIEVLAVASDVGIPVKEIPVTWTDHSGSSFRPLYDGIGVAREMRRFARRRRRPLVVDRPIFVPVR